MKAPDCIAGLTFAVQHNLNCPSPWLVRLAGPKQALIDLKPYSGWGVDRGELTKDALGFGKTFEKIARAACAELSAASPSYGPAEFGSLCDQHERIKGVHVSFAVAAEHPALALIIDQAKVLADATRPPRQAASDTKVADVDNGQASHIVLRNNWRVSHSPPALPSMHRHWDCLNRRAEQLKEAEQFAVRSRAAKVMDEAWSSRSVFPSCPHCKRGIAPDDVAKGVSQVGRYY